MFKFMIAKPTYLHCLNLLLNFNLFKLIEAIDDSYSSKNFADIG